MKIPSFLFGTPKQVASQAKKALAGVKGDFDLATIESDLLDTSEVQGLLVLNKARSASAENFQLYGLLDELPALPFEALAKAKGAVKAAALEREWVFACLLGQLGSMALIQRSPYDLELLGAARGYWSSIEALGARWSSGIGEPSTLWAIPNALHVVLAGCGVPKEELTRPLPPGGLGALIERHVPQAR